VIRRCRPTVLPGFWRNLNHRPFGKALTIRLARRNSAPCSPARIDGRDAPAPPTGFAEIVSDDFPVFDAMVSLPSNMSCHTNGTVDASLFGSEQGHENIRDEIAEEMHRDCDPKVSLVDVDTRKNCAGQHRNDNSRLTLAVM
jgi:hypothetical protein